MRERALLSVEGRRLEESNEAVMPSQRRPSYRVACHHQPFVRMLVNMGLSLAAVPVRELTGQRLYLGVRCQDATQAKKHTAEIVRELLIEQPELLPGLDLGTWKARRLSNRMCLFWTGIEVEPITVH
jgi:hypothetical protein